MSHAIFQASGEGCEWVLRATKPPHPPQIPGGLAAGGREVLIGLNIDRDTSAPFEDVSPQRELAEPCLNFQ